MGTGPPISRTTTGQKAHYTPPWAEMNLVGIAGSSGSGKTSLAIEIIKALNLPWVVLLGIVRTRGRCWRRSRLRLGPGFLLQITNPRAKRSGTCKRVRPWFSELNWFRPSCPKAQGAQARVGPPPIYYLYSIIRMLIYEANAQISLSIHLRNINGRRRPCPSIRHMWWSWRASLRSTTLGSWRCWIWRFMLRLTRIFAYPAEVSNISDWLESL